MMSILPYMALALLLVLGFIPLALRLAFKTHFLDHPGGRKQHEGAVPPVGGLVVFPVFMLIASFVVRDWGDTIWFYAALALILIMGALDDRLVVPPWIKFTIQFVAAFLIVLPGHARVMALGDLFGFGVFWLSFLSIPFSMIATVLLVNAINLVDGLDGLAGGMGLIILGGMALCAGLAGGNLPVGELLVLCSALAGFLFYNMRSPWRKKASIFIGDAGSLALGLALSWYAIRLAGRPVTLVSPASVAWLLALPIMDTCGQFARRIAEGRHPFSADQDHFHHHFVRVGLTPGRATFAVLSIAFLYGALGIIGIRAGVPSWVLMYIWAALLLVHIYLSMHPEKFRVLIARLLRIEYHPA